MIFVYMFICAAHFMMCGAWLGELYQDRIGGFKTPWQCYAWIVISFLFGMCAMISLIGLTSNVKVL